MCQLVLSTGVCAAALLGAIWQRQRLWRFLCEFWSAPGSPYNLAVFRIVLFTTFFLSVSVPATIWFSQMPAQLQFAPFGLRKILPGIPITPSLARLAAILLLVFLVLAAIGLIMRFSAAVATILGLYVLGLPHFYGKVNHLHHHLIWFAALMAVSPCADVLSADAAIRNRRRDSREAAPQPAFEYGLPLRFVWLLIGVIYFFPGFWKLCHVGLAWTAAENIKYQMYAKWAEFGGWTPALRVDRHPFLCTLGGIGIVAFEISFLPLVFFRRCRPWLVIAGLGFHNITGFFMRIWFAPLQAMYVALIDWDALFRRFRQRWLKPERPEETLSRSAIAATTGSRRRVVPIIVVGTVLLLVNVSFGVLHISEAWPFACYPAFDFRANDLRQVLTVSVETPNGVIIELDRTGLSRYLPPERERGLEEALLRIKDPARRLLRFKAFWQLWRQNHPELRDARTVRFYHDTLSTIPGSAARPLQRELLATIPSGND
jgi:hypothetical protein